MYLKEKKAEIINDGNEKWSASTLHQIAEATSRILQRDEITKNRMVYIQSFCVTQNEVIASFERATGSKWSVTKFDGKEYEREEKKKAEAGDLEAIENLVWYLGAVDANWEGRKDFAMQDLGLKDEDLEVVVKKTVEKLSRESQL